MFFFLFFKRMTAYKRRISDWSSDLCSSDLVLCGEAQGSGDRRRFAATVRAGLIWGVVLGCAATGIYFFHGAQLAAWFSTDESVVAETGTYVFWVSLLPLLGVASFVLDGVFVGAGWTRAMLGTMALALATYAGQIGRAHV